jgi:osmotically-inducible protein OsmY
VKRVAGVAGVVNDIEVRLPARDKLSDPEIAREIIAALQRALPSTWENIRPLIHEGRVTLEGSVDWHYHREIADDAVRGVRGVVSVGNMIRIQPKAKSVQPAQIKQQIEEAFRRHAQIDAKHVLVDASGAEVTLRGEVGSCDERDQAERTAWSAPGVTHVRNEITVRT